MKRKHLFAGCITLLWISIAAATPAFAATMQLDHLGGSIVFEAFQTDIALNKFYNRTDNNNAAGMPFDRNDYADDILFIAAIESSYQDNRSNFGGLGLLLGLDNNRVLDPNNNDTTDGTFTAGFVGLNDNARYHFDDSGEVVLQNGRLVGGDFDWYAPTGSDGAVFQLPSMDSTIIQLTAMLGINQILLLTPDGNGGAIANEILFDDNNRLRVSQVPLPSTLLLFGSGLMGMALQKKKTKTSK